MYQKSLLHYKGFLNIFRHLNDFKKSFKAEKYIEAKNVKMHIYSDIVISKILLQPGNKTLFIFQIFFLIKSSPHYILKSFDFLSAK